MRRSDLLSQFPAASNLRGVNSTLNPLSAAVEPSDAELVALSRSGDRNSFGRIVGRYQSLVCAITYSSCGNVAQSEDLAQEVFFSAWKQLHGLREPERLKQWLGGIARQAAIQAYRRNRREPTHLAGELPPDASAPEPPPFESAIRQEEEQLLWRALERLPVTYREALVLYYREHRSIEHVACALDLSEENVRQRLSRGRKALQDEVVAMLDGTLSTSAPGGLFTSVVVAALPHLTPVGSVAVGGAAVKGSVTFKTTLAGLTGLAAWTTGSFFALLGMFTQLRTAQTSGERRRTFSKWAVLWFGCSVYAAGLCSLSFGPPGYWSTHPQARTATIVAAAAIYLLSVGIFLWRCAAGWVWAEPGNNDGVAGVVEARRSESHHEFISRARWLGLPLLHIRYRLQGNGPIAPAKGWIAIGNVAYGAVFACGGLTVAPISCGILSLGLVSLGGFASGGFAFGFVALGFYGMGGMAVGFLAYGGSALGWMAALGNVAIARDFAQGGAATTLAAHANDVAARHAMAGLFFFRHSQSLLSVCLALAWMPLLFSLWWRRRGRGLAENESP
jgi:RNA polymerase sigma factor (sigma-70 family)